MSTKTLRYGWYVPKLRIWKKIFSNVPMVDFGLSFGGEATIRGRVSRIEVRDGVMKLPVSVTSQ
jgi:hypothetical protein